jgi:hypothetical protein
VRETAWLRPEHDRRNKRVLRGDPVAVERRERENLVADRDVAHIARDLRDDARQLVGRNRRQAVDRPRQLVARDGSGVDAHERLAALRARHLELLHR